MDLTRPLDALKATSERHPLPTWRHSATLAARGSAPKNATWAKAARARFKLVVQLDAELWAACEQLDDRPGRELAGFDKDERRRPLLGRFKAGHCKSYWTPLLGGALLLDLLRAVPLHGWTLHLHDDLRKTRVSFWADPRTVAPFSVASDVIAHGAPASELRKRVARLAKRAKHHPRDDVQPWAEVWRGLRTS